MSESCSGLICHGRIMVAAIEASVLRKEKVGVGCARRGRGVHVWGPALSVDRSNRIHMDHDMLLNTNPRTKF